MNKYQESLNYIIDKYIDMHYEGRPMNEDTEHALCLQELVDKEAPKKPIDIEFGPCGDLMLCCPTCKHGVVPIPTYHGNKYYPRCPFCGQNLEGENEDER